MNSRIYLHQLAVAVDQLLNTLLAGYADETLSSRAYRCQHDKRRWLYARIVIDAIFFWQEEHCRASYISELVRGHLPGHYEQMRNNKNTCSIQQQETTLTG